MIQIESFQEFRAGLALLRGGDAHKALPHLRSALEQEPSNPFYISYMGVAIAAAEQKWAEAEKLCHSAMRLNRRQAQLYLNLAEVYVAADRRQDAADILARGLHYAPHDVRLKMALDRLALKTKDACAALRERGEDIKGFSAVVRHFGTWRRAKVKGR